LPIDRAVTLRNAEKLIRQGKLEAAIAEFVRIVEDQPQDWNAKNTLGDLYARAGQVDKAIDQFMEIADNLNDEGAVAKAGAIYKKVIKLKPDHERGLWQVSEILANQKLYVDARTNLNKLIELRRAKGDTRGALQAKVRLGSLDPEDYESRRSGAAARIEMGDVAGAMRDLKEIAGELSDKGRQAEAIDVLREAANLNADDEEVREKLFDVHIAGQDYAGARDYATSVEQFKMIAAALEAQGQADDALATLRQAAGAHPHDTELATELAKKFLARGDAESAAEYLTVEVAGDDPALLMTVAEMKLRGDSVDDGLAIVKRLLEEDSSRREQIALLGWTVAEQKPDAGFAVVELAADAAVTQNDWPGAAAALQEFVTRVPNHIPALMRLVEICVDGGLEATMYSAQGQLADAYIAAGAATEARFIAEDLVAREPWDNENVARFRRALVLLGEPDPDALIAARLSGESPFMSTDLFSLHESAKAAEPPPPTPEEEAAAMEQLLASAAEAEEAPKKKRATKPVRRQHEEHHFELSSNAIDLDSILGDFDTPSTPAQAHDVEVDLSVVLDDIKSGQAPATAPEEPPAQTEDLESVFGNMRDQSRRSGLDDAEKEYKRGLALRKAGDIDGCIAALTKASRAPKLRFSTSWLIARLYRDRNMSPEALEWLGRAAEAPPPNAEDGYLVLYELADLLEQSGESARALAICIELDSDAPGYRDVAERIDRLTKVQAEG
jgi:tetratricopeptide (TPR) repeat protein